MTQFYKQSEFKQLCRLLENVLHGDLIFGSEIGNWSFKKVRRKLDMVLDLAINISNHLEWNEDYKDDVIQYYNSVRELAAHDIRMCQTIHEFVESRIKISEEFDWL